MFMASSKGVNFYTPLHNKIHFQRQRGVNPFPGQLPGRGMYLLERCVPLVFRSSALEFRLGRAAYPQNRENLQ